MSDYKKAFNDARNKYRKSGVEGVHMPNSDSGHARYAPIRDPKRNVIAKNGVVYIGGDNIKTTTGRPPSNIHIFHYGEKDGEEETKKN